MATTRLVITHPQQIKQTPLGHRLFTGRGAHMVYADQRGLTYGSQPVDVVLAYTEPPQELHGYYYPDPQFMDLP